jgi:hypothetical protein
MQIVIEIEEETYNLVKSWNYPTDTAHKMLFELVTNSTPLQKGHGRILDEKDILDTENNDGGWYDLVDLPEYIAGVKAIIEADKESEDEG